ncbi:MAG TPA: prepilin-type N-terminal cleavage/methylation domain-containing protein [Candidatus Dependentiae bacterium]|nr:prepilin-type N-terminal cleavage/methylation domain-containing protein [Candidatus Dependentiae bacterium]HRQ63043.1 prepilin-type N-terminal cleavage/methylation domain-containing protein [Candidatus Dependentiae bacterium]
MIHSKHKSGFTLLETLFAMVIIAAVMSPLFFMQADVLRRVAGVSNHMQRIFFMRDFLFNARQQQPKNTTQFTLEKRVSNPETILRYELKPVDKKSALSSVQGMYTERVTAMWSYNNQRKDDVLCTLQCIASEQAS